MTYIFKVVNILLKYSITYKKYNLFKLLLLLNLGQKVKDSHGTTILHQICLLPDAEIFYDLLLSKKIILNKEVDRDGNFPIHYAVCQNNKNMIDRFLLEDIELLGVKNNNGEGLLYWAMAFHNMDLVNFFMEKGLKDERVSERLEMLKKYCITEKIYKIGEIPSENDSKHIVNLPKKES